MPPTVLLWLSGPKQLHARTERTCTASPEAPAAARSRLQYLEFVEAASFAAAKGCCEASFGSCDHLHNAVHGVRHQIAFGLRGECHPQRCMPPGPAGEMMAPTQNAGIERGWWDRFDQPEVPSQAAVRCLPLITCPRLV